MLIKALLWSKKFPGNKVVSGSFHPVRLVPGRSTFYKRRLHTQLDLQIYYKSTSCYILLQSGESIITKWGSFHVLQIGTSAITKWGSFFVLQSGASSIAK